MQSRNLTLYIMLLVVAFSIASCQKDFLTNTPKGFKLATTAKDFNDMLEDNVLSSMANYISGGGSFSPAPSPGILGDDVAVLYPVFTNFSSFYGGTAQAALDLFKWSPDIWIRDANCNELQASYNKIYIANKIINEVMDATGGTEQEKLQYRAEGQANRAFNYFLLMNLFTKPYNAATAESDLGLPLVTEANTVANSFQRATLKATYDFVVKDLVEAIPHLPLVQTNATRFTKSAAEALLGKIYLFTGHAEEAEVQLDAAFSHLPAAFTINGNIGLINYNTADENPFPISSYVFNTPGLTGDAQRHPYPESLLARDMFTFFIGGQMMTGIVVTPETLQIFQPGDKRLSLFSSNWGLGDGQAGIIPFGLKRINAGNFGYSVGIQLPDMYLLRAEAKARNSKIGEATTALVELRKHRMPEAAAAQVPAGKDALIRFIINERKREFCGFGIFRWYDMRRLSLDPLFAGEVYRHYQYHQTEGLQYTYTLSTERLVLKFPQVIVKQNPGFEQNQ